MEVSRKDKWVSWNLLKVKGGKYKRVWWDQVNVGSRKRLVFFS
jgi:hypothetical protein